MMRLAATALLLAGIFAVLGPNWAQPDADLPSASSRHLLSVRDQFTTGIKPAPAPLKNGALNFARGVKRGRLTAGPVYHMLPRVVWGNISQPAEYNKVVDYFLGAEQFMLICALFAGFTLLGWFTFCVMRAGCDGCGGRHAKQRYTHKDVWYHKIAAAAFVLTTTICFGICMSGNGGQSIAIDDAFKAADGLVNYLYAFRAWVVQVSNVAGTAAQSIRLLNSTVRACVPDAAGVFSWQVCVNTTYTLLSNQTVVTNELKSMQSTLNNARFLQTSNSLNALDAQMPSMPALTPLQNDLDLLNASLTAMPSVSAVHASVVALQASYASLANLGTLESEVVTYNTDAHSFSTTTLTQSLTSTSNGYASMPSLSQIQTELNDTLPTPIVLNQLKTDLTNFDNQIVSMGNQATLASALSTFATAKTNLLGLQALPNALDAAQNAINSMPNVTRLWVQLAEIMAVVNATHLNPIIALETTDGNALATMPNLALVSSELTNINTQSKLLLAKSGPSSIGGLIGTLNYYNKTVAYLSCLGVVLNALTLANETVYALPDSAKPIFSHKHQILHQINDTVLIQHRISTAIKGLHTLNNTLSMLPDLTAVAAILNVPDLLTGATQLKALRDAAPYLMPYITAFKNVDAARRVPQLHPLATYLRNINSSLGPVPSVAPWIANANALSSAFNGNTLHTNVQAAIACINQGAVCDANGISPASLKNSVYDGVTAVSAAMTQWPGTSATNSLITALNNLGSAISAANTVAASETAMTNLDNAMTSTPSLSTLATGLSNLQTELLPSSQSTLVAATQPTQPLATFDFVKTNVRFSSIAQLTNQAYQDVLAANLSLVISEIDNSTDYFTESDRDEAITRLRELGDFNARLGAVDNATSRIVDRSAQLAGWADDMYRWRNNYLASRNQKYSEWIGTDDEFRLLVFDGFLFIAFLLSFCGFASCAFKRAGLAMFMALSLFPLIAFFFVFAALHMPFSMFFADHCPDWDNNVALQASGYNLSMGYFDSVVKLDYPMSSESVFRYLALCEGSEPELITSLRNPEKVLAAQNINFTYQIDYISKFKHNATLRPTIINIFNDLINIEPSLLETAAELANHLECNQTAAVYAPVKGFICDELAGNFALAGGMYFLMAFCLMPGIAIGIRGYKRFDRHAEEGAVDEEEEEGEDEEAEYEFDDVGTGRGGRGQVSLNLGGARKVSAAAAHPPAHAPASRPSAAAHYGQQQPHHAGVQMSDLSAPPSYPQNDRQLAAVQFVPTTAAYNSPAQAQQPFYDGRAG